MGRRKKTDEELEQVEPQLEEEAADEAEETENAEQAEASEEADETASEAAAEEAPAPKPKRKPRQRRSRAKKTETPVAASGLEGMAKAMETATAPAETKTPTVLVMPTTPSAPLTVAPTTIAADPTQLRADAEVADLSIHKSMDSMVKQWASVKDISTSVCTNLDRVATVLQTLQTEHTSSVQELSKQGAAKMGMANRISVGISALAIVLSLISLSFSQAARQALFNKAEKTAAAAPTAQPTYAAKTVDSRSVEVPESTTFHSPEKRTERNESLALARPSRSPKKSAVKSGTELRTNGAGIGGRRFERPAYKSTKK